MWRVAANSRSILSRSLRPVSSSWLRVGVRFCSDEPREAMEYDVVIVGAGPAGLSAAIRLKQLSAEQNKDLSVCIVEKGAEVGAHILSGNCFEPRALNELIPDWKERDAPIKTEVKEDKMFFLTEKHKFPLPIPPSLHNEGNYIISLSQLTRWLATHAEELGVEIFPGFAASEVLYDEGGSVVGVATGDMGIAKDGSRKPTYARGMELRGRQTIFSEGCRGSLTKTLLSRYDLTKNSQPQTYGLGIKEVWEISPEKSQPGLVTHTIGWPLPQNVYGGSFMYHMDDNKVLLGYVVGLDYENPFISPYQEFQKFKTHPAIREVLEGGQCVQYGARTINEGGLQSIPKLTFPGGLLIGCSAGFLNVAKIKGTHTAMKSGMIAAESIFEALTNTESTEPLEVEAYEQNIKSSWVYEELTAVRNVRPAFHYGLLPGLLYSGLELIFLKGRVPWTLKHAGPDHKQTKPASNFTPIDYPRPDGVLTFDLLSNLYRSGTNHDHNSPVHLKLTDKDVPAKVNYAVFGAPESRYCPAKVYEYVTDENGQNPRLVINAQNCLHCKACDIKDPTQNINWTVPEGGGGPAYTEM